MTASTRTKILGTLAPAASAVFALSLMSPVIAAIGVAGISAGGLGWWAVGDSRRLLPAAMAVAAAGSVAAVSLSFYLTGSLLPAISAVDGTGGAPIAALVWVWGFGAILMPYVLMAAGRLAFVSSDPRRAAVAGMIACSAFFVHFVASDHLVLMPISNLATKFTSSVEALEMRADAIAEKRGSEHRAADIDRYVLTKIVLGEEGINGIEPPRSFEDFLRTRGSSPN